MNYPDDINTCATMDSSSPFYDPEAFGCYPCKYCEELVEDNDICDECDKNFGATIGTINGYAYQIKRILEAIPEALHTPLNKELHEVWGLANKIERASK